MIVALKPDKIAWCLKHATAMVKHYESLYGCKQYNHNKIDSNMVGVQGEMAVANYLKSVDPTLEIRENYVDFSNNTLKGDIVVAPNTVIEVKTVRPHHWENLGRMVPPKQLTKYLNRKAIIIWAVAAPHDLEVTLKGWNHAQEIAQLGVYKKTICDNTWLEDESHMHPMESLFELF